MICEKNVDEEGSFYRSEDEIRRVEHLLNHYLKQGSSLDESVRTAPEVLDDHRVADSFSEQDVVNMFLDHWE